MSTASDRSAVDATFDPAEIEAGAGMDAHDLPESEADAFEMAEVTSGFTKSADQIEEESSFDEIPPGEWPLYVAGFLAAPKQETKTVYLAGRRMTYTAYSVVVKLARKGVPGQQVTDYFLLPPDNPAEWPAYFQGAKSPEGKGAGFMANKLTHFLERIGFAMPAGGGLPAEARKLGNWRRRECVAKIVPGDPYTDQTAGETKPGRNKVKLFSYRAAGSPASGPAPVASTVPGGHATPPRRPGTPNSQQQMAASGLDNI